MSTEITNIGTKKMFVLTRNRRGKDIKTLKIMAIVRDLKLLDATRFKPSICFDGAKKYENNIANKNKLFNVFNCGILKYLLIINKIKKDTRDKPT